MKKLWRSGSAALLVVAVVAGGATAGTTRATKTVVFTAAYSGTATTQQTDNLVKIAASGSGKGTLLGAGKIAGKASADSSARPCVPFNGPGAMTGTSGTKLNFKVTPDAKGCGDDAGQVFSLVGHATVISATGKLKRAKGTLKFTGTYDRSSGAFTVKFTGKLTL